jgi:hypothetical protein
MDCGLSRAERGVVCSATVTPTFLLYIDSREKIIAVVILPISFPFCDERPVTIACIAVDSYLQALLPCERWLQVRVVSARFSSKQAHHFRQEIFYRAFPHLVPM